MNPPRDGLMEITSGLSRRWPTLVTLIVMWIALWGDVSIANILGGAGIAVVVLMFAGKVQPAPVRNFDVVAALRYLQTFTLQLLVANWQVAKAVVQPDKINPGILAMPLHHASDAVVTLVANSITLTPGTLTLETDRRGDVAILYVHALDVSDVDGVREDICELEVLAVDAFAGADAQAVQARTLAELEERDVNEGEPPPDAARPGVEWPDSGAAGRSAEAQTRKRRSAANGRDDGEDMQ